MDELQRKLAERRKKQGDEAPEQASVSSSPAALGGAPKPGKLNMGGFNPLMPGGGRGVPMPGMAGPPNPIQPGGRYVPTRLRRNAQC
eukprot:2420171-Rhodomonas_salina.3